MKKLLDGVLVDLTDAEIAEKNTRETAWNNNAVNRALNRLRVKRNKLLTETDFYALSDVTMSDDMKTYRQELRDLPEGKDTVDKCENAVFPTKPGE